MKKIISLVLCAVLLSGSLCITTPAAETEVHFTDASEAVSVTGATVTYDEYLCAVKVETDGSGAAVTFNIGGMESENVTYAVFLPKSYKTGDLSLTFGETAVTVTAGHKFTKASVSDSGANTVTLPAAERAYAVYFYGAALDADAIVAEANGSLNEFDESFLDLSEYEVERYTKYFWDNDIVFHESFFPIKEKDGTIAPISLMYDIDRVVSVKNSYLNLEYTYGVDYTIENGKLILNPEGSMLIYDYTKVYSDTQKNSSYRQTLDGGYAFCGQQMMYFVGYLNITYTPADTWTGIVPESKGFLLPNSTAKLTTPGSTVKLLSIGDSLAGGANASISNGTLPYADIWCDMVAKGVQNRYPDVTVETTTIAQGGATASLAIEKMSEILTYAPDLVFIEFGTNECMQGDSPWLEGGYVDTLTSAIAALNEALPQCDIVLVAPIISNPIFFPEDWFYAYADALYSLEREGVIVADSTSLYQYMLSQKRYIDMTGDFLCHPSDFGTRLFVQTILKALETGSEAAYIKGLSERIVNYRYENEFYPEQWAEYTALAASAAADIADEATLSGARELYRSYAAQLDAVQTAKEIDDSASIDCEKLIFSTAKTLDTVDPNQKVNAATRFEEDEKALLATVTNARKPAFVLDYSVGERTLTADDYGYAVITCMEPSSNGSRATTSTVAFIVNGETLSATSVKQAKDDRYHSYIIDLTGVEGFTGTVDGVKIGVYSYASVGDALYISSIILCADAESAEDTAIERERAANNDAASAVTYLMSNDETCEAVKGALEDAYIRGDVDGNGVLNSKDLLKLRRYLAGDDSIVPSAGADADGDTLVGASDVVRIRRTLAELEEVTLAGNSCADVVYDEVQQAAKVTFKADNGTLTADLEGAGYTADMFKYVTLCAKTADGSAVNVTVTVTTDTGSATDTVLVEAGEFFTADTAKFTSLTGNIESVSFTFENSEGDVIYFDSFVLTPTYSAAQNAETVRVGAANLI